MIPLRLPALDFDLGETVDLLRDAVMRFAADHIAPRGADIERAKASPADLWRKMGEIGILGITAEEEYGGAGLGYLEQVVAVEELSRASGSVGLSYGAHAIQCVDPISRNATEAQKRRLLPRLLAGEHVGTLARGEPGVETDVLNVPLRAERRGDRFVLNGTVKWVTNGGVANTFVAYASTDPAAGARGITAFVIERRFSGIVTSPAPDALGMRGADICELTLDACEVPEENVLGTVGLGIEVLKDGLDHERLVLAGGPLGIIQACLDLAVPYVHQRQERGRPIGEQAAVQAGLADMYTALNASRAYVYAVANACDRGLAVSKDATGAMLLAAQQATRTALDTIQCLGAEGYVDEYPTGGLLRDAQRYEVAFGTVEARRRLIGRELFRETV